MQDLIQKFQLVLEQIERQGDVSFCGLFLRDNALQKWDFVIAAPWLNPRDLESYKVVSQAIQKILSNDELVQLAGIVILREENNELIKAVKKLVKGKQVSRLWEPQVLPTNSDFKVLEAYILLS
ncbi:MULTISPECIES: hypothetical protein [Parachlamydia]|uniref:hypothetical protein n=1 Tax=Parachlamydia TaxID=83551 RepID=UPI000750B88A|nr:hypothetical protein [Parachlamydia acanthamoebae]